MTSSAKTGSNTKVKLPLLQFYIDLAKSSQADTAEFDQYVQPLIVYTKRLEGRVPTSVLAEQNIKLMLKYVDTIEEVRNIARQANLAEPLKPYIIESLKVVGKFLNDTIDHHTSTSVLGWVSFMASYFYENVYFAITNSPLAILSVPTNYFTDGHPGYFVAGKGNAISFQFATQTQRLTDLVHASVCVADKAKCEIEKCQTYELKDNIEGMDVKVNLFKLWVEYNKAVRILGGVDREGTHTVTQYHVDLLDLLVGLAEVSNDSTFTCTNLD